ncbi:MAG: restriction endonuclease subunit S [Pseudomonas protegens]|nr:MAG: restriction endonuclease subunit S [Pseudomonas protegens]
MSFLKYPAHKDSGVNWLGDVPAHWDIKKFRYVFDESPEKITEEVLGDMLSVSGYRGIEVKQYDDEGRRRTDDELIGYRIVRPGQLVVNTMWLNYAGLGVSEYEGHVSPAYRSYWIDSEMDKRFIHHLMRSGTYVQGYTRLLTGIRPNSLQMGRDDLMVFPVLLPTKPEQTQIARFLDHETGRIDALIQEQQRLIELLKEKRQAVISHAVTKGLDPAMPMKDSGVEWLGEVPAHWVVSRAKLVSDIFVPQRNKPELNDSEGIAWVTMEDMNGGYISATNLKVTELAADEAGSKVLKKGAVIASCVGRFGIVAINAVDVVINQQLQAFEPRKIKAEYLRNIVSISKEYFELIGTAATLVYVNQQGFENLPVLIPSVSEQESICLYVEEANARFDALLSQSFESIQLLQERRSALISAAVTGKIDVRGWQQLASAPTPKLAQEAV